MEQVLISLLASMVVAGVVGIITFVITSRMATEKVKLQVDSLAHKVDIVQSLQSSQAILLTAVATHVEWLVRKNGGPILDQGERK